jgi:hypothetical protein
MSLKYINRKDQTYYLQAGKTRTGKPRYWFGKKLTGEPVEAIPGGYEVRESPENGTVTLRKIRPSEIAPPEIEFLSNAIRKEAGLEHFIVDVDGNSLVVYLPGMSEREAERTIRELAGPLSLMSHRAAEFKASLIARSGYDKMMQFELVDGDERLFTVQRWCFRGSIDDWIWLGGPAPLPDLIRKYVRHLGQESFYDMI